MSVYSILAARGLARGSVVQSLAGHDRLRPYVVLGSEGCFVFLADGSLRPLERPKKKRARHVRALGMLPHPEQLDTISKLGDSGQRNSALRRLLADYLQQSEPKEGT